MSELSVTDLLGDEDCELSLPTLDALSELDAEDLAATDLAMTQALEKLAALEAALTGKHPEISTLLKSIHQHLLKHPEVTSVLPPEQIGVYIRGLKDLAQVQITTTAPKKPKVAGMSAKELKEMALDDLA